MPAGPVSSTYIVIRGDGAPALSEIRKLEAAATAGGNKVENTLASKFQSAGKKMSSVGRTMNRNVTLPIVALGAASVKMALDFDKSMTNIRALVGASDAQMEQYKSTIMDMAGAVGKSPKELADALYFVTSSGFEGAEALDVLEVSARASAAGLGETQIVADAVTSAVNSYGAANLSASDAADVLAATVREGKGEPEELAAAIGRVIPVSQQLGVEFDEVGGALASLTLGGLDAAEATTALRGVLTSLLDPTDKAKDVMDELGYSSDELREMLASDFIGTLMELKDATHGNTEQMGALFGNVRGLVGQLSLTGANADKVRGIMDELANSSGSVDAAFAELQEDPTFQLRQSWAELQTVLIDVGNKVIPLVTDVASAVAGLGKAFGALPDPVQNAILVMLGMAAVTGPMLKVAGAVTQVVAPVVAVTTALKAMTAGEILLSLDLLRTKAGLLLASFAPLATTLVGVSLAIEGVKEAANGLEYTGKGAESAAAWLEEFDETGRDLAAGPATSAVADFTDEMGRLAGTLSGTASANIASGISSVVDGIGKAFPNATGQIESTDDAFKQLARQASASGRHIEAFAGMTRDDLTKWRVDATESIVGTTSEFVKMGDKGKLSFDKLQDAMQRQLDAVVNFRDNIHNLVRKGASEDFIRSLIDMGAEGKQWADILADENSKTIKSFEGTRTRVTDVSNSVIGNLGRWYDGAERVRGKLKEVDTTLRNMPTHKTIYLEYQGRVTGNFPSGSGGHFAAATGFHGYVNRPTVIVAGEAGRERVDISPMSELKSRASSSSDGGGTQMIEGVLHIPGLGKGYIQGEVVAQSSKTSRRANRWDAVRT